MPTLPNLANTKTTHILLKTCTKIKTIPYHTITYCIKHNILQNTQLQYGYYPTLASHPIYKLQPKLIPQLKHRSHPKNKSHKKERLHPKHITPQQPIPHPKTKLNLKPKYLHQIPRNHPKCNPSPHKYTYHLITTKNNHIHLTRHLHPNPFKT